MTSPSPRLPTPSLLTLTVFLGLLLPWLVRDGMFLDGVTYAAISRNLAEGQGSFWVPHYTETLYPQFFEHPPLVFGIESLFFRLLGDSMATERIYTGLMALISMILIMRLWRLFTETDEQMSFAWMPGLLWIATPVVFWSFRNNMLENTLTVMVLASAWFIGKSLLTGKAYWLLPASVMVLGAFLSKGPVGLFIVVMPLAYSLITNRIKNRKAIWFTGLLVLLPVLLFLLICLIQPQAWDSIRNYFESQVLPSVAGGRENTVNNRLEILLNLVGQLSFPSILVISITLIGRVLGGRESAFPTRTGWYMLTIGLAGSLPLMATLKHHDYYFVPSIPFFAIGLAMIIPQYEKLRIPIHGKIPRWVRPTGIAALAGVLILSVFLAGKPYRDRDLLKDVEAISAFTGSKVTLMTTEQQMSDWRLIAYLSRLADISLDSKKLHRYFVAGSHEPVPDSITLIYDRFDADLTGFKLFIRKENLP